MLDMAQGGFLNIYTCEPDLQGLPLNSAARHAQRALQTRSFPLFKYSANGSPYFTERIDLKSNPALEADWVTGSDEKVFTPADWAVHEQMYKNEFRVYAKIDWQDNMMPLDQYINLPGDKLKEHIPFITITDNNSNVHRVAVSEKIVAMTMQHLQTWRILQELAGIRQHDRAYQVEKWESLLNTKLNEQKSQLEDEYNSKLYHVQNEHWQIYHGRLLEKLKAIHSIRSDKETLTKTLR